MSAPFPLSPVPAHFVTITPPRRNGVFYDGDQVTFTLNKTGATGYEVRNYDGDIIASGVPSGLSLTIPAPDGGWDLGWYRLYLTGSTNDALFGLSYGATTFVILADDSRFPDAPTSEAGLISAGAAEMADRTAGATFGYMVRYEVDNVLDAEGWLPWITAELPNEPWDDPELDEEDRIAKEISVSFPYQTWDELSLIGSTSGLECIAVYIKDGSVDGDTTFVQVDNGTVSGRKITVRSPDASTVVETFDNLTTLSGCIAALDTSDYVQGFPWPYWARAQELPVVSAATAIGGQYWKGLREVVAGVYPLATWFEGPYNEPQADPPAEVAHRMRLFRDAVKDAAPAAKVMGVATVSIVEGMGQGNVVDGHGDFIDQFIEAGGVEYLDAFSFHSYNVVQGDLTNARKNLSYFRDLLADYDLEDLPLWETELGDDYTNVFGVYHPRRARWRILSVLAHEAYGTPRERIYYFNDTSHGFWAHPSWMINGDGSPNPQAALLRTLMAETWNKPFLEEMTFEPCADLYLCNVYEGTDGARTITMIATSAGMAPLTVLVAGASELTVVDAWGNEQDLPVTGGTVELPVREIPVYVRVPAGVTVTPAQVGEFPRIGSATLGENLATTSTPTTSNGAATELIDGTVDNYTGTSLPDWAMLRWGSPRYFDHVIIRAGRVFQNDSTLIDFDIQISDDGSTWETVQTVTKDTPSSFLHGTNANGTGTQRETYWDEQWVWDITLPELVRAAYLRIYVRETSYGGEPDAAAVTTGGQGSEDQFLVLQEIEVYCNDTARTRIVIA